jgi:hypothetical protein
MFPPFCHVPETRGGASRQSVSVDVESGWKIIVTSVIKPTSLLER